MTPLNRFARLNKHLKNALRGVGIGLLSALLDIKAKPRAPLILLHFLLCGGCVALMVAMLSALNHFPVNASVILITGALFIVIYLPLSFILYRSQR